METSGAALLSYLCMGFWDGGDYKDAPGFAESSICWEIAGACLSGGGVIKLLKHLRWLKAIEPINKGKRGVDAMIAAKSLDGYTLLAKEVTIATKGGRFRIDAVMKHTDGTIHFFENKAGLGRATKNQVQRWTEFEIGGGRGVGKRAKEAGVRGKIKPHKVTVERYGY